MRKMEVGCMRHHGSMFRTAWQWNLFFEKIGSFFCKRFCIVCVHVQHCNLYTCASNWTVGTQTIHLTPTHSLEACIHALSDTTYMHASIHSHLRDTRQMAIIKRHSSHSSKCLEWCPYAFTMCMNIRHTSQTTMSLPKNIENYDIWICAFSHMHISTRTLFLECLSSILRQHWSRRLFTVAEESIRWEAISHRPFLKKIVENNRMDTIFRTYYMWKRKTHACRIAARIRRALCVWHASSALHV